MRIFGIGGFVTEHSRRIPFSLRAYARVIAVALVSLGLLKLLGFVSWPWVASFYHVTLGALFGYVGFFQRDEVHVREEIGGLGALMLVVAVITILSHLLLGEAPLQSIEATSLVVGITSALAAKLLRDGAPVHDQERRT